MGSVIVGARTWQRSCGETVYYSLFTFGIGLEHGFWVEWDVFDESAFLFCRHGWMDGWLCIFLPGSEVLAH